MSSCFANGFAGTPADVSLKQGNPGPRDRLPGQEFVMHIRIVGGLLLFLAGTGLIRAQSNSAPSLSASEASEPGEVVNLSDLDPPPVKGEAVRVTQDELRQAFELPPAAALPATPS